MCSELFIRTTQSKFGGRIHIIREPQIDDPTIDPVELKKLAPLIVPAENICPGCGKELSGVAGSFTWDSHNGSDGYCFYCGLRYKLVHIVGDRNVKFLELVEKP